MANPFPVEILDENGAVRLAGTADFTDSGNQPGGTFNGGTITGQLAIAVGGDAFKVENAGATQTFVVVNTTTGSIALVSNPALAASRLDLSTSAITFTDENAAVLLDIEGGYVSLGATGEVVVLPSNYLAITSHSAPADGALDPGMLAPWFDQTNGAAKLMIKAKQADGTVVAPGLTGRDLATAPAVSAASTLALGTAYQNTLGYDVLLCIYLSVTVNTSGVLKLGVGPTTTPTQQTLVTGITSTGLWPVPIYLPNQYYALLSVTGTITVAVDGQIAMPV